MQRRGGTFRGNRVESRIYNRGKDCGGNRNREKDTSDPFRLVIVDWKMPDMDGIETTRQLRQKIGSEIPVIILTAYDWSEIEHEAKKSGVTSFISKPFYRSKLCYLLNELSRR